MEIDLDNDDDRPVSGQEPVIVQCGELIFKKKKKEKSESESIPEDRKNRSERSISPDRARRRSISPEFSRPRQRSTSSEASDHLEYDRSSDRLKADTSTDLVDPLAPQNNPLKRTAHDRPQRRQHYGHGGIEYDGRRRNHRHYDDDRRDWRSRDRYQDRRGDSYYDRRYSAGSLNRPSVPDRGRLEADNKPSDSGPAIKYKGRGNMTYREKY